MVGGTVKLLWLWALVACGVGSDEGAADHVDGDEVALACPGGGKPVRLRVPREAVVQTYICDSERRRCSTIGHTLVGDLVEVRCNASPTLERVIRWTAPVR